MRYTGIVPTGLGLNMSFGSYKHQRWYPEAVPKKRSQIKATFTTTTVNESHSLSV